MVNFLNISLTYGIGFFLLRSISFLLLPLYTNLLTVSDAGIVFLVYTILAFLNPVYAFGMDSALLKFYNSTEYDKKEITASSLITLIVSSFFLSLFIILLSNYYSVFLNFSYNSLFFIAIVLFFDSVSARLLVLLRLLENPIYYLFVGLVNILSSILFNLLFLKYYSLGGFGAIYALTCTAFVQFLFLFPILIKNIKIHAFNYALIKKMFLFGIPFLPATILFIITGISDRWLIKHYLGLEQVGLYGAGYKIGSVVSILVLAFNLSWQPYYLKYYKNKNFISRINKISYFFFIILIFFSSGISLFWPLLITININGYSLIGESFWGGGVIIPWVAFGYFFYGLFVLQSPSIYLHNKQNWAPFFWFIAALSNILINIILIPRLGLVGAGISSLTSYLLIFLILFYKNQRWLKNNFIDLFLICLGLGSIIVVVLNQILLYPYPSYFLFVLLGIICFVKIKARTSL